jgi:hypothetical protein
VRHFTFTAGIIFDAERPDQTAQYLLLPSPHYVLVVDEDEESVTPVDEFGLK